MKPGNLVFFKEAQNGVRPGWEGVKFRGFGYGFLLGMMSPNQPEPPDEVVQIQLGAIGLLRFDDVLEFLGPEALSEVTDKWELKYNPVKAPPNGADHEHHPPKLVLESMERKGEKS